jgi:hypothetical protein
MRGFHPRNAPAGHLNIPVPPGAAAVGQRAFGALRNFFAASKMPPKKTSANTRAIMFSTLQPPVPKNINTRLCQHYGNFSLYEREIRISKQFIAKN